VPATSRWAAAVKPFVRYVALGDSMSIDRYPSIELSSDGSDFLPSNRDPELPELRLSSRLAELPVGAASLLFRNHDDLWPEFESRDLVSMSPGIRALNLATDGAIIPDVVRTQLPSVEENERETLVTLTVGGNDLLLAFSDSRSRGDMQRAVRGIIDEYEVCVGLIRRTVPRALLVLTTVYDPSDGTGRIPGFYEADPPLPLEFLSEVNGAIARLAGRRGYGVLADVHAHFLGHGATAEPGERWYWATSMIEPGARGASEIRRVWLDALA
jgi:lysophospholipase L1-like esterase